MHLLQSVIPPRVKNCSKYPKKRSLSQIADSQQRHPPRISHVQRKQIARMQYGLLFGSCRYSSSQPYHLPLNFLCQVLNSLEQDPDIFLDIFFSSFGSSSWSRLPIASATGDPFKDQAGTEWDDSGKNERSASRDFSCRQRPRLLKGAR